MKESLNQSMERRICFEKVDANSNYWWTWLHDMMILLYDNFSIFDKCSANITQVQDTHTFFREERTFVTHNKCSCSHFIAMFHTLSSSIHRNQEFNIHDVVLKWSTSPCTLTLHQCLSTIV